MWAQTKAGVSQHGDQDSKVPDACWHLIGVGRVRATCLAAWTSTSSRIVSRIIVVISVMMMIIIDSTS